jgi:hypothetical protein
MHDHLSILRALCKPVGSSVGGIGGILLSGSVSSWSNICTSFDKGYEHSGEGKQMEHVLTHLHCSFPQYCLRPYAVKSVELL